MNKCSFSECEKQIHCRGYCKYHYTKLFDIPNRGTCTIDGCVRTILSKSLCAMHHRRVRLTGNPGPAKPIRNLKVNGKCGTCEGTEFYNRHCVNCYRHYQLQRAYGIDADQYQELLLKQNEVCAICRKKELSGKSKKGYLSVDHDHETGEIRGLLCSKCNFAIGLLEDDLTIIKNALKYLSKNE